LLAVFAAILSGAVQVHAAPSQPSRFLLIFEMSSAQKKNLSTVRETLDKLLANNVQNELSPDDDLAVWTVDQDLHTGGFPLASWSPDDSTMYADRLDEFLGRQKYTRHATLAALQPLLNRVVKHSDRLTVLVFCDTQSRLLGTPYDAGVNEIITNATARAKGKIGPMILVLRAYHGEYIGCSVNRAAALSFPQFPPPPKPEPPPVAVKPAPASGPAPVVPPASGPVVTPVPAMIIVGTNISTNIPSAASAPASVSVPAPAPAPSPSVPSPVNVPASVNPPHAVNAMTAVATPAAPPVALTPKPVPAPSAPAAHETASVSPVSPTPSPAVTPAPLLPEPVVAHANADAATPSSSSYFRPMWIGGGALVVAIALIVFLVFRARRPRSSLITSSMNHPPDRRG
jgi:hypothetical protein